MKPRVRPDQWRPQGIKELESAAENAVRSTKNSLVVAGPGAGKTELLAQRACYLLQTGLCPQPRAILAISFKRDAARNLAERVRLRCGDELARRFHSYTFDAFAKSVVDRFSAALPEEWRPSHDYEVDFKIESQFRDLLKEVPTSLGGLSHAEVAQIATDRLYKTIFAGKPLIAIDEITNSLEQRAIRSMWNYLLHGVPKSRLNFHMIGRLAEFILATNPQVLRALRATYAYAFLDEFQDTTSVHYDLTCTAFRDSSTVVTAVGDIKQSIMRWALALRGIFASYRTDFSAEVHNPLRNYRSAPNLVKIIGSLAGAIEKGSPMPHSMDSGSDGEGECRLLEFADAGAEAVTVASIIRKRIDEGVQPREICILTRQKVEQYSKSLLEQLKAMGVEARVEEKLQNLLAEPVTEILLDYLKIALLPQAPDSWERAKEFLFRTKGCNNEREERQLANELSEFGSRLAAAGAIRPITKEMILQLVREIVNHVTSEALRSQFPQYEQGAFLKDQLLQFIDELLKCTSSGNWRTAFDQLEGSNSVPVMTIHKSKGLEYHTVIFLGLEDYCFRSFKKVEDDEESCAFFVALSRARKSVVFTFCGKRAGSTQSRTTIQPLYNLLLQAGVPVEKDAKL